MFNSQDFGQPHHYTKCILADGMMALALCSPGCMFVCSFYCIENVRDNSQGPGVTKGLCPTC